MEDFDASIREKLFYDVSKEEVSPPCKITVVGVGMVGMACTVCTLLNDLATDLVLVDVMEDKLKGEVLDLRHGSLFLGGANITGGSDYSLTAGSKVVVITAGVRQKVGESRLSLVQRNVDIFKHIIPQIARHSPDAVLLLISNPVDLMTYVAWKLSGFPRHRVIGSGTNLDSARFRHVIASRLQVCPSSVHGLIVGEHGDSSVPLWSSVTVAGRNLSHIEPRIGRKDGPKGWDRIHHEVVRGAYEVIQLKGYTNWAIGFSCAQIVRAITRNSRTVLPLSCFVKDVMGTDEDVCLSLPCTVDSSGVSQIVRPALDSDELFAFRRSVKLLAQVQNDVKW